MLHNRKEEGKLGSASARSASQEEDLEIGSSSLPFHYQQPPKGVLVLRLVDEVQSVFGAKHGRPLTRGADSRLRLGDGPRSLPLVSSASCFPSSNT